MMGSRAGNAIAEQTLEERDQGLAFLCWFILKNLLEELFEAGSRRIQAVPIGGDGCFDVIFRLPWPELACL